MLRQPTEQELLLAIEESLCTAIEDNLESIDKQLPDMNEDELVNGYMQSHAVKKFMLHCQSRFPGIATDRVAELVRGYFQSQISLSHAVMMEQNIITISQYIRKYFGIDASITLLENIHDEHFDLETFMTKHVAAQQTKQAENNQAITIFTKKEKYQQIEALIKRLRNVYLHAAIKRQYYDNPLLQQTEKAYQKLQESLMWMDGQRHTCVTGMRNVNSDTLDTPVITQDTAPLTTNKMQGARRHLENVLGIYVAGELDAMANLISDMSVDDVVNAMKRNKDIAGFQRTLSNEMRAGLTVFLPDASLEELQNLLDEYLVTNVHLAQSFVYERNVIRMSHFVRQQYGIDIARKLLIEIEQADFTIEKCFAGLEMPRQDIRAMIENLHKFHVYAYIKEEDEFFDKNEPEAKKLFESKMWINLQRQFCLQGLALMQSGAVYRNQRINPGKELQTAAAKPVSAVMAASSREPAPALSPAEYRLPRKSSSATILSSIHSDWIKLQGSMTEQEALETALRQSQIEMSEQREIERAIESSLHEQGHEDAGQFARHLNNNNRNEFSVLADALHMLDLLQGLARRREHAIDNARSYETSTTDEEDWQYEMNHFATITIEQTDLPRKRFKAANKLLDECMKAYCRDTIGNHQRNHPLELSYSAYLDKATIKASHHHAELSPATPFGIQEARNLTAPIALFPFEQLKDVMMAMMSTCFNDWQSDTMRLVKTIPCNLNSYNTLACSFYYLQGVCEQFDSDFKLGIQLDDSHLYTKNQFTISVDKTMLEQAKKLLGYHRSFQFNARPSAVEMLMATSPIISRQQQERGMVRSSSMEFKFNY